MTEVFVWATGQDENIGDSLLRRPLLEFARTLGTVNVYLGEATDEFQSGLGLAPQDRKYTYFREWLRDAARSARRGPTLIVPNAGEVPVSRRGAVKFVGISMVVRLRHASGLWLGAGVPGAHSLLARPYAATARQSLFAAFRSSDSFDAVGAGELMPDWAFTLGTPAADWKPEHQRHLLAVVLRGDRPAPSHEWTSWVKSVAEKHSLRPIVVVQVHRDEARAQEIASILGADVLNFAPETSHAEQESCVRAAYRDSLLVIGDRLHGLVVGATEGAVPLGWVESSSGKVDRHFQTVGLHFVGENESQHVDAYGDISRDQIATWREMLTTAVSEARGAISSVQLESRNRVRARLGNSGL